MKSLLFQIKQKKYVLIGLVLLLVSLVLQSYPVFDYFVQNIFYDKLTKTWLIQESPFLRLVLYTMPKVILGIVSMMLIVFYTTTHNHPYKIWNVSAFLFCMAFIPFMISIFKAKTNIHCPKDLIHFSGIVPFRSVFDINSYKQILELYGNGNCFPGGHASGGYAFMSSFFILEEEYKISGVVIGFLLGTYMGLYQMAKGAHFFSHTLFTFGFSIVVISLIDSKRFCMSK